MCFWVNLSFVNTSIHFVSYLLRFVSWGLWARNLQILCRWFTQLFSGYCGPSHRWNKSQFHSQFLHPSFLRGRLKMRLTVCRPCSFTLLSQSMWCCWEDRKSQHVHTVSEPDLWAATGCGVLLDAHSSSRTLCSPLLWWKDMWEGQQHAKACLREIFLEILGRSNYIVCNMLIGHSHSSGAGCPALVKLGLRIKQDWGNAVRDVHYCHIEWLLVLLSVPKSGRL